MTLSANGLCMAYGSQPVLRDVTFDVRSGETLAEAAASAF